MSIVDATREYLSVDEVVRRLAVSGRTIERRIETGDIPAVRLGGPRSAVRVPEAALEAWLWSGGRADAARYRFAWKAAVNGSLLLFHRSSTGESADPRPAERLLAGRGRASHVSRQWLPLVGDVTAWQPHPSLQEAGAWRRSYHRSRESGRDRAGSECGRLNRCRDGR